MTQDRNLQLAEIDDKFKLDTQKKQTAANKKELEAEKQQSKSRADTANALTSILVGALGDSLGAKLAGIAIQGAVEAGLIGITTASAQAQNIAQATAVGPPQNIPLIITALAQNTVMGANSAAAIAKVIASSALQGVGNIFEEGGMLSGPSHSRGGIRIEAEGGEAIINRRSMENPMLRSLASRINEIGGGQRFFAEGGLVGSSINSSLNSSLGISLEQINALIDGKIANIRVQNLAIETLETGGDVLAVENFANL